jgi:TPR repeat protein
VNAPQNIDAWRVAALCEMPAEKLHAVLAGEDATDWIEAAARCGFVDAQLRLGRMLLEAGAYDEAFAWFARAARSADADALNMLGRCYENGWGTAPSATRAAELYLCAAEAGHAWAQYNLGHLLLDGNGVARDLTGAFQWYARAADQGHERAMNLLSRCYAEGWGVARNAKCARDWYRKSAQGGYFRGCYNYATLLVTDGCAFAASIWFKRSLATAPEPTRDFIRTALANRPEPLLRRLAA